MLKSLWNFIQRNPKPYIIGTLIAIVSSCFYIVPNYIIQQFVDGIVEGTLNQNHLVHLAWIYGLVMLASYLTDYIMIYLLFKQSYQYQVELRLEAFKRLMTFRKPFYHLFRSGDLMTRMTSDIDALGNMMTYGFIIIVADGIWMVILVAYLIIMVSWRLTLVSFLPLVFFGIVVFYLGKVVDKRYTASRDAVADLSNQVLEVVEGVRVMRAYGKAHLEQEKFQEKTQTVSNKFYHQYFANALYTPAVRFFTGLVVVISIAYGAIQVDQGLITIGQLVAFQIYLSMFLYTIWGITDIFALYQTGKVSYKKLLEILNHQNPVKSKANHPIDHFNQLELKNYYFTYPESQEPALKNITLSLKKGQTLGIVGKTGSGKTTLISQLLRQYPLDSGQVVVINNQPIDDYAIEEIEQLIGYVPQDHILFSRSVKDNILFGDQKAQEMDLLSAIEAAHFSQDIDNLNEGLDTMIGEKGVAISGGQKQRVSIARALISQPQLLIMDDSLSAVDAKTEGAIIEQIQTLRRDKTNIIVTHRLSAVMQADHIIVLEDGEIIEEGTAESLLSQNGWFKQQFDQQQMEE